MRRSAKTDRQQAGGYKIFETSLESFLQLHVPESAFDGGKRFVVVVLEGTGDERRIRIKDVLHSDGQRRVIEPGPRSTRIVLSRGNGKRVFFLAVFHSHILPSILS